MPEEVLISKEVEARKMSLFVPELYNPNCPGMSFWYKSDRDFTTSKLELLSMTYNRFVKYWDMATTLQKTLEVVQSEIRGLQSEGRKGNQDSSSHRPTVAKRRSFKSSASVPVIDDAGWGELQDPRKHKICGKPSETDTDSLVVATVQLQNDSASVEKRVWHGIPEMGNRNDIYHGSLATYGQMGAGLFGNTSAQDSAGKTSNNVDAFLASASTTVPQLPVMGQPMPTSNGLGTQESLALYPSVSSETDLSPDFYVGDFTGANPDLSQYFGDILSGGYIA